jgi:hypothetical protein
MNDEVIDRVYKMLQAAKPGSPAEVGELLATMTAEERAAYREMSEMGTLPGDEGGGFSLVYGDGEETE